MSRAACTLLRESSAVNGSKAVKLCIEYLQREFSACRISAPVKMEHIAAQEFWIKQGFCLSDTIEDGYVFMRLYLI